MNSDESPCQDEICAGRQQQNDPVHGNRPRVEVILTHPSGSKWNQRQPEQQVQVGPQSCTVHALSCVQQVMMIVPINSDVNEAQDVAQENSYHWP